jgi:hypothetical protein
MHRQTQELQQRLMLEAQAIAAAAGAAPGLPGLLLPPAHAGTAALVAGLGAATATAPSSSPPPMVMSHRTWQLEPATTTALTAASPAGYVPYMFSSGSRAPSAGGGLPPAVFLAPPRD